MQIDTNIIGAIIGALGGIIGAVLSGLFSRKKGNEVSSKIETYINLKNCPNMDSEKDQELINSFRDSILREKEIARRRRNGWVILFFIILASGILSYITQKQTGMNPQTEFMILSILLGFCLITGSYTVYSGMADFVESYSMKNPNDKTFFRRKWMRFFGKESKCKTKGNGSS